MITALRTIGAAALISLMAACASGDGKDDTSEGSNAITAAPENYPIVLVHGFFGFNTFAGLDFLTYFFNVKSDLAAHGEAQVFTPALDPFNDSTVRGAQLEAAITQILQQTGAKKVNIIGHSQGGLDARVVAHNRPDIVASVTTISSPHEGSHLSDVVLGVTDIPVIGPATGELVDALVRILGTPIWDKLGHDTSVVKALRQVTTSSMVTFNQHYTDDPSVKYFSLAGRTAESDGGSGCQVSSSPTFIAQSVRTLDATDPLLAVPELVTSGLPLLDEPNDGFVRVSEARHGTFLGCIPADHFDEIGQLAGDNPGSNWNYLEFYRGLVAQLRTSGL